MRFPRSWRTLPCRRGGFHQYTGVLSALGSPAQGYVRVERIEGKAPFYAYGVINDQVNSDGSFVFPVAARSLEGTASLTLPVIVETGPFTSELTVANFSRKKRTLQLHFVAEGVRTDDHTASFTVTLLGGEQQILPDIVEALRRQGVEGIGGEGGLAGALFATVEKGDMDGIVIAARTGSPDGRGGGRYGVFYNAVPDSAAFTQTAWVDALQQNGENRSNLALVNTGAVDGGDSLFSLEIHDGKTGALVKTLTRTVPARGWLQINGILRYAPRTPQGYVRIHKLSGRNPFLAYGVVNDGASPGQRSGDGAYLPARR